MEEKKKEKIALRTDKGVEYTSECAYKFYPNNAKATITASTGKALKNKIKHKIYNKLTNKNNTGHTEWWDGEIEKFVDIVSKEMNYPKRQSIKNMLKATEIEVIHELRQQIYHHWCISGCEMGEALESCKLPTRLSDEADKVLEGAGIQLLLPHEFQFSMVKKQLERYNTLLKKLMDNLEDKEVSVKSLGIITKSIRDIHTEINESMIRISQYPATSELQYKDMFIKLMGALSGLENEMCNSCGEKIGKMLVEVSKNMQKEPMQNISSN